MIVPTLELLVITQSAASLAVQTPSLVRLTVYPFRSWLMAIFVALRVVVGIICSPVSET
jgi:hypothetical protein